MKYLNNYICTLEQSKKLKELGVEQDSLYYWIIDKESGSGCIVLEQEVNSVTIDMLVLNGSNKWTNKITCEKKPYKSEKDIFAAFTSQELGKLINNHLSYMDIGIYQSISGLIEFYQNDANKVGVFFVPRKDMEKEAQARAEFLIYLIEKEMEHYK